MKILEADAVLGQFPIECRILWTRHIRNIGEVIELTLDPVGALDLEIVVEVDSRLLHARCFCSHLGTIV